MISQLFHVVKRFLKKEEHSTKSLNLTQKLNNLLTNGKTSAIL